MLVGKFTLYELLPVNAFVPANVTSPPPPATLSTYSFVVRILLAFISANKALHITFFVNVLSPRDKKLPDKSTDATSITELPAELVKSLTDKLPKIVVLLYLLNVGLDII